MSSKLKQRIVIVAGIVVLVGIFKILGLDRYLPLSYLKASRASFAALYEGHPVTVIGTYVIIHILVTALSLPVSGM